MLGDRRPDLGTDLADPLESDLGALVLEEQRRAGSEHDQPGDREGDHDGRPPLATATLRILVCGSRKFRDRSSLWTILDGYLAGMHDGEHLGIISGMAPGADRLGYQWALEHPEVALGEFPADWDGPNGKAAGFIRNQQMLDEGEPHLGLAFTDDLVDSRGTADMVRRLKKAKVPYLVIGQQDPPQR
jgi:hypothetical protein